ncbi:MAG: hypothetical protein U0744_11100 [Gemmataceae bacterium]
MQDICDRVAILNEGELQSSTASATCSKTCSVSNCGPRRRADQRDLRRELEAVMAKHGRSIEGSSAIRRRRWKSCSSVSWPSKAHLSRRYLPDQEEIAGGGSSQHVTAAKQ